MARETCRCGRVARARRRAAARAAIPPLAALRDGAIALWESGARRRARRARRMRDEAQRGRDERRRGRATIELVVHDQLVERASAVRSRRSRVRHRAELPADDDAPLARAWRWLVVARRRSATAAAAERCGQRALRHARAAGDTTGRGSRCRRPSRNCLSTARRPSRRRSRCARSCSRDAPGRRRWRQVRWAHARRAPRDGGSFRGASRRRIGRAYDDSRRRSGMTSRGHRSRRSERRWRPGCAGDPSSAGGRLDWARRSCERRLAPLSRLPSSRRRSHAQGRFAEAEALLSERLRCCRPADPAVAGAAAIVHESTGQRAARRFGEALDRAAVGCPAASETD